MKKKLSRWEQLLDFFVMYDHLEANMLNRDPAGWTSWLYEKINDAGFKLEKPEDVTEVKHAEIVKRAIHGMLSNAWNTDAGRSSVQAKLFKGNGGPTYDYDAMDDVNRAYSVTTEPIPVAVCSSKDSNYFFELGNSVENGIIFVMKFCLEAAEINHVVKCKECSKFFFAKRSDATYCSTNCKTVYNRRKK